MAGAPGGGTLDARGQLHLDTASLDARVALAGVDVAPARVYLPGRATIGGKADGELLLKGTLSPLVVTLAGALAVADATVGDGQRLLLNAKRMALDGIDVAWPARVAVERVALQQPWALLERDSDGAFPLLALAGVTGSAPARPAPVGGPTKDGAVPPTALRVGSLIVEEGFVRVVDRTVTPEFVEEASRVSFTARGLGTEPGTRSDIALRGRLSGGVPVELSGALGALRGPLNADLAGKLTDMPLTKVSPYVDRLVGWVARRGSVTATVRYRVRDNQLDGSNDFLVAQPEFAPSQRGDAVRDRVGLPLGTLVALLKNARGEIRIAVPIKGNLATREFDLDDAFWEGVRQAAIGVLALPVSWVGKLFYTEDARIDTVRIWPVYFEPGTTTVQRGFDEHADRLAGFLRDAPGVVLALKPVLTVDDLAALRREAVRQRVATLARESSQPPAAAAAKLFAERFPGTDAPSELDGLVEALAKEEPAPDAAADALAARRLELTRARLQELGKIAPERLRPGEGVVPVEGSGLGRVEFEITS